MRRILIPAIAAALAAYAGHASAQGPAGREGPASGGGHPSAGPSSGPPGGMHAPGGGAPQRDMSGPRAAPERGSGNERPGRGAEGPARTERRQAEPQQPNRERERATQHEQNRAAGQQQRVQERNAERERARAAEQDRDQKRAEERRGRSTEQPDARRDRQAGERNKEGERVAQRREEIRSARDRLGREERQRFRTAFNFQRARATNARFDTHVGHRVPRSVHLYPVPREVITFFPYYRDYSYVVVDDDICIVDPRTYEIVDVIDQGYYGGGPNREIAGLSLSQSQMALIRDSIPRDFPETPIRLRLALGAEVSGDVEIYEFPATLLDRIPKLNEYRFLVIEDQIVIVEPRDRSIALVIDRS